MNAICENDPVKLVLEQDVTIYTAQEVKQRLMESLEQGEEVEADLSGVSEFDTAGLQVLLLAIAEAVRNGKKLYFTGFSPAVEEVVNLCHLTYFFNSPLCAAPTRSPA